jgi:hypothetical protein
MFTDLFRIVAEHGLSIPPEIAAVFRALATMEGTLTQLAPGFDIITETRRFAAAYLTGQLRPGTASPSTSSSATACWSSPRSSPCACWSRSCGPEQPERGPEGEPHGRATHYRTLVGGYGHWRSTTAPFG